MGSVLERGDLAAPKGEGGIILVPDEKQLQHWERMARDFLGGTAYSEVGRRIYEEKGVEGFHKGTFDNSTVRKILSNVALVARDNHRRAADDAVQRAQAEVRRLEGQLRSLVKTISLTAGDDDDLREMLDEEAEPVKRQLAAARSDLEECEALAASKEETWAAVSELICETKNLASLLSSLEDEDPRRKTLFDYWLLDLLIVVEPVRERSG